MARTAFPHSHTARAGVEQRGATVTAYHQMGNDSTNLIGAVPGFGGAVLSPVNEAEPAVRAVVERYQSAQFEFVFDPQLYFPQNSNRGQLRTWSYFPSDFETADLGQPSWW